MPQMALAVALLIVVQTIYTAASGMVLGNADAWPLLYLAPLFGLVAATGLLWYAQQPRRRRPQASAP